MFACCTNVPAVKDDDGTLGPTVKVFGMPASANACSGILMAMDAGVGGFVMCNLSEGEHMKPEFLAMNPFHHIPTCKDGDLAMGESNAILRYLAMKYKPALYPVEDPCRCGMIDFALESFGGDVYPKISYPIFYIPFEFAQAPADHDQAKANQAATEVVDTWVKHFITGKFVCGDEICIADFKAVPFFWALMHPGIEEKTGFKLSDRAKQYTEDFMRAVPACGFLKDAGGYSISEYASMKCPDGSLKSFLYEKVSHSAAPALGKPDGKVKVHALPMSANACSSVLVAMEAGVGGMEMCNIMAGDQMKPEFLAMNPFHHIPTVQDGGFAIGESNACLRYLALKYKPELYPTKDPAACAKIDFAIESFAGDVYPKIAPGVFYPVFEFCGPPADQKKANEEASEILDTWMKHFVKGKFVNGDSVSIADFKAVPFLFALMQPVIETKTGFKVSDAVKDYTNNFLAAVKSSEFLKAAGGSSLAEYAQSKA